MMNAHKFRKFIEYLLVHLKKYANKLYIRRKGQIVLTFHVNETRWLSIEWQACILKRFCSTKSAESQNVTITQRHACTKFYSLEKFCKLLHEMCKTPLPK